MKVLVISFEKKANGRDTVYFEGRPQKISTLVSFPMEFGYGSYNEPRRIKGTDIQVDDIISIEPVPSISIPYEQDVQEEGFIG